MKTQTFQVRKTWKVFLFDRSKVGDSWQSVLWDWQSNCGSMDADSQRRNPMNHTTDLEISDWYYKLTGIAS